MEQLDHAGGAQYARTVRQPLRLLLPSLGGLVATTLLACASAQKTDGALLSRPVDRSSIQTLLRHRGELNFDSEQVARLEELEQQRTLQIAPLMEGAQAAAERRSSAPNDGKKLAPRLTPDLPPNMRDASEGAAASKLGPTGRRDWMYEDKGPLNVDDEINRLIQKMDDIDSRSYVDAITQVLMPAQRPAAEKLANDYRAALFDYREDRRTRGLHPEP